MGVGTFPTELSGRLRHVFSPAGAGPETLKMCIRDRSSARAVRCRLKCHNERNPCCQLLTGSAEYSDKTAIVRCEEGGDDVKSARPLRPGLHLSLIHILSFSNALVN